MQQLSLFDTPLDRPASIAPDIWQQFSHYEKQIAIKLLDGETVVCAMHNFSKPDTAFICWAKSLGKFQRIDRATNFGNPFRVGEAGSLPEVIERYRDYVDEHPQLKQRVENELRGVALGCWCKKRDGNQLCHGDVLAAIANNRDRMSN